MGFRLGAGRRRRAYAYWTSPPRGIVRCATLPCDRGAPTSRPLATRSTAGALPIVSRSPFVSRKTRRSPADSRPWNNTFPEKVVTDIQVRSVVTRTSAIASVGSRACADGGGDAGACEGGRELAVTEPGVPWSADFVGDPPVPSRL